MWSVTPCGLVKIVVSENLADFIAIIVDSVSRILPNMANTPDQSASHLRRQYF